MTMKSSLLARALASTTHQAKPCIDAGLHIDMHGSLGIQQPGSHMHQRAQYVRRGLRDHQNLAGSVEPVQLQMRACKEDINQIYSLSQHASITLFGLLHTKQAAWGALGSY